MIFWGFSIILSLNISFPNDFLEPIAYISNYLPKFRCFRCTFSAYFFHEHFPDRILYQLTMFQYQTFFTSKYIKQFVFKFQLKQTIDVKTISFSHKFSKFQKGVGGEERSTYMWISQQRGGLFGKIKSTFWNLLSAFFWFICLKERTEPSTFLSSPVL